MLPSRRVPGTHWKINGWFIENHPFAKEKHLNQTFIIVIHVNLRAEWELESTPNKNKWRQNMKNSGKHPKKIKAIHTVMGWIILNKILNFCSFWTNSPRYPSTGQSPRYPSTVHQGDSIAWESPPTQQPGCSNVCRKSGKFCMFLLENTVWSCQFYSKCRY